MMMALTLMMTISFMFMWLKHPISMGITIIAQTLVISMITGLLMNSFWFSYIITIIMLSGMLVLFIYMASVASNEKFYTSTTLILITLIMMFSSITSQLLSSNYDNEFYIMITNLSTENLSLNALMNCKFKYITMATVLYLLFTMIVVSLIVNISEGPLRTSKK